MGFGEFDYLDEPESYRTAMAQLYDREPEELGEEDYRLLSEEEQRKVTEMVEMNDIIGQQAGGLAGIADLNDAHSALEASDD